VISTQHGAITSQLVCNSNFVGKNKASFTLNGLERIKTLIQYHLATGIISLCSFKKYCIIVSL